MPIQSKVSDILTGFPAQTPSEKISLASALFDLGEDGIIELCRRLSPPGMADDTLARYALEAAGTYAMRPGAGTDRSLYCRGIIKAMKSVADPDVGMFLIARLQLAGGAESIEPLSHLLSDPRLAEPAARALLAIRAPGMDKGFLKALRPSGQFNTPILLRGLGELRSREAVGRIMPFASDVEGDIRNAALDALANIGDPRVEFLLSRIDIASTPRERAGAASRYLLFARRQAEGGRKNEALRICRSLVEKCTGQEESQVRCAALTVLSNISGKEGIPDLIRAMDTPDSEFRAHALDLALRIRGEDTVGQWIAKASEVTPPARAQIIGMLGQRGDRTALDFIREGLGSEDRAVRVAAIEAAARLQVSETAAELASLWQKADEEEAEALGKAFLSIPAGKALPEVAKAFAGASLPAKTAIIEILGERGSKEYAGIVMTAVGNEDENISKKALAALRAVVRVEDLPQTIRLLERATEPFAVLSLQNALAASARQVADPEKRSDLIIGAMREAKGQKRIDLLRPLGQLGGERALRAVVAETRSADPQVRSVAVYTLTNWPDFQAASELLRIARTEAAASRKFHFIALQGYIRLITEAAAPAEQKLALIKDALLIAGEPSDINLILDGLAKTRCGESLSLIAGFLEDPAFKLKAARSAVDCALPSPGFGGLQGFETARILKRAAQFLSEEYDRALVEQYANGLLTREGFVPLFNGKNLSGWKGLVKDPPARARMDPRELKKEQDEADKEMRLHWRVIDGALVFDGRGQSLCTAKDYADFELFVDWKIDPQGDSGIYLRGSPQVQIWDPGQWPEGSGGVYNNKIGLAKPLRPADNPVGEWNTFYIRMAGERVTVHLNGVLVVDNVIMENYWERDKPIYPSGQIELQAHSTLLYFKNVYIRELRNPN